MANYQTITMDIDKLKEILGETPCGLCPDKVSCENDFSKCADLILEGLMPPQEYEFDFHIIKKIRAKNVEVAQQIANDYLIEICAGDEDIIEKQGALYKR